MIIDENEFFREATFRICGHLDFEIALQECLIYIRSFLPADLFHLTIYDRELDALKTIAWVSPTKAEKTHLIVPLDSKSKVFIEESDTRSSFIMDPSKSKILASVSRKMIDFGILWKDHSSIVMNLQVKNTRPGNLILFSKGQNRYSKEHLRLCSILNEPFTIAYSNALRYHELNRLKDTMVDDIRYLHQKLARPSGETIIGEGLGLKKVMEMVKKVAPLDSPVLLLGETGVGKEMIAKAIHQTSLRNKGPFIKVNCGAIPDTLIDSELFGHEKGSFTGAINRKRGCFERAGAGTIFLDEIGELPLPAQVRMLRVLQEKKIQRVGGTKEVDVDIRIIAATHQNLEEMVENKQFRSDFWFRLNVFPVVIPPLRERKEDILALLNYFIEKKSKELGISIASQLVSGSLDALKSYSWPGNVRELENVVERTLILQRGGPLAFDDIIWQKKPVQQKPGNSDVTEFLTLDAVNKQHIIQALKLTGGKVHGPKGAAELLDLNPSTLRFRIRKHNIIFDRKQGYERQKRELLKNGNSPLTHKK